MTYLGEDIPKLGFGLMRLPKTDRNNDTSIDIEQVKDMVDIFMDAGFTYFDTAFGYHGGFSEVAAKEAIVARYPRESFQLATKMPASSARSAEAAHAMFYTSLERSGAGYFDYYLMHNMGGTRTALFEKYGIWDFVSEQKEKGLIKHFGFSFHDKAEPLEALLKAHPEAEFVQLQINYADWESPVVEARKCYEVARAFNKPIIIMEPVRGGSLATLPTSVADVFKAADSAASLPSWALRFAASKEGIITTLSGMSTPEQVHENVALMRDFKPLTAEEHQVITKAQEALEALPNIACTACKYCLEECIEGIQIPSILSTLNTYLKYENLEGARRGYGFATMRVKASACTECGACERVCPQQIAIIDELKRSVELLENS
ncbi:MAG: aldo/keto reductase [Coriobacteriaceae bacterium]|jgi:predicted aldo/keto reductase-like oxidoreductase|nr:aldo/keto reductase [Coriobacteriaceae bacterium]